MSSGTERLSEDALVEGPPSTATNVAPPTVELVGTGRAPLLEFWDDEGEPSTRYQILRLHAKGGLGLVYVAQDAEVGRSVALKEIQEAVADDPEVRARFLREAEITGRLEHPGIVPVYGIGRHANGRPYYAMRLVQGETLREAILRFHAAQKAQPEALSHNLEFRRLLQQLIAVCQTLDYAHAQGVIHRDIKPQNILTGKHGETLVVDWGLGKHYRDGNSEARGDGASATSGVALEDISNDLTVMGTIYGTPPYMSPEQARGDVAQLGPATDVYSVGATLYELLVGSPPVEMTTQEDTARRVVLGDFPPPRARNRSIPANLEAICLKAMAREPADRYRSTAALAQDLERYLADERVLAHREPFAAGSWRWVRRHRLIATSVTLIVVAALVALAIAWEYQNSLNRSEHENELVSKAYRAEQKRAAAQKFYADLSRLQERSRSRPAGWTWQHQETLASLPGTVERDARTEGLLRSELLAAATSFDLRQQETLVENFDGYCMALDPAGKCLAVGCNRAIGGSIEVKLLSLVDRKFDRVLSLTPSWWYMVKAGRIDGVRSLAFSPDGQRLAVGQRSGHVQIIDLESPEASPRVLVGHTNYVTDVLFAAEGRQLISVSEDGDLRVWDFATGKEEAKASVGGEIYRAALMGRRVYLACEAGGRVFDLDTLKLLPDVDAHIGRGVVAFPDGEAMIAATSEGLEIWPYDRKTRIDRFIDPRLDRAHSVHVKQLALSPSGRYLASASSVTLKLWDVVTRQLVHTIPTSGEGNVYVAFHSHRPELFVGSNQRVVRYELREPSALKALGFASAGVATMDLAPDGRRLVTTTTYSNRAGDRTTTLGRVYNNPADAAVQAHVHTYDHCGEALPALSDEGLLAVAIPEANRLDLYRADSGEALAQGIKIQMPALPMFAADALWCRGTRPELLPGVTRRNGVDFLMAYRLPSLEPLPKWVNQWSGVSKGTSKISAIAGGPTVMVASSDDEQLRVFDAASGKLGPTRGLKSLVESLALTSDEKLILGGDRQGTLHLWRTAGGDPVVSIPAHEGQIDAVTIAGSSEEALVASGAWDGNVRLWRLKSGNLHEIATLRAGVRPITRLRFSPQGEKLYFLAEDDVAVRRLDVSEFRSAASTLGLAW